MKIAQHTVVTMDYTLKDGEGTVLDTSEGKQPLVYLHGVGGLIPGLEKELNGKEKGANLHAIIAPEEAYGVREEDLVQVVSKQNFKGDGEIQVGMQVQVQSQQGQHIASISKVEGDEVTLDLNHPLAGVTLHFDVDVLDVREATADEISDGQVQQ